MGSAFMDTKLTTNKLHLGCGHNIKNGWVNHDIVELPGVDIVHDLTVFPWPWENGYFDEVIAKDVFEHLPDTVRTVEEIYRITKPGAYVHISVPYWNSWESVTDPTHCTTFNEFTFEFFDPRLSRCINRPYYSSARFYISKIGFGIAPLRPYLKIPGISKYRIIQNKYLKLLLGIMASYFNNIIVGLEIYLERP